MNGIGYYKWTDGKKYMGEYLNNHKHGFGICRLNDKAVHHGYWAKGRGHGLGWIERAGHQPKYWLFEDGKQGHEFDETEVAQVNAKELDFR